jgi:thioesterase domain-containing protein/acyl carrier protein
MHKPTLNPQTDSIEVVRDDIEQQLITIWEQLLEIHPIGIEDDFFELGGDSMAAVQLFDEIEEIWGQNLPLSILFKNNTISQLATVIRQESRTVPWSSLVHIQQGNEERLPLFCIHPVGGNILEYQTLSSYLGSEQTVYGLQSRGLDGKEAPLNRVEDMAKHYIDELQSVQKQGPYFLVGYSFGGLVAYEMARQLVERGKTVGMLVLLDSTAPELPKQSPSFFPALGIHLNNLFNMNWAERISYVNDRFVYQLKRSERDFLSSHVYNLADLPPLLTEILNANLDARSHYTAKTYSGKVNLFRCHSQDLRYYRHPKLGWEKLVDKLEVHNISGLHSSILKEPRVQFVARELKSCLQII